MSHYSKVKTKIKNREALLKALKKIENGRFANIVKVHDTPQEMNAHRSYYEQEKGNTAEIIMKYTDLGTYNDVGFAKQADGTYQAVISDLDFGRKFNQQWLDGLTQQYSREVIYDIANQYGYTTNEEIMGNEIVITCTGGF